MHAASKHDGCFQFINAGPFFAGGGDNFRKSGGTLGDGFKGGKLQFAQRRVHMIGDRHEVFALFLGQPLHQRDAFFA